MIVYLNDINIVPLPFKLYYSNNPFTVNTLPATYVACSAGLTSVDVPTASTTFYIMSVIDAGISGKKIPGRLTPVQKTPISPLQSALPPGVSTGIYFNADNSTTTAATYTLKGNTTTTNYSAAITTATVNSQKYINGNGSSWLKFPTAFTSSLGVSAFAKVIPPTTATGTTYNLSDPVISSYESGTGLDIMLGFGATGVMIFSERDQVQRTFTLNNYNQVIGLATPIVIYGYWPLIPTETSYSVGGTISGIVTTNVSASIAGDVRFEGIMGGVGGGRFGHNGKIRSVLVLEGSLSAYHTNLIMQAMHRD